jgi:hypothetical protein
LETGAVNQNNLDVQRSKDGNIEENVREILRAKNLAIDCDNKDFVPETRDILQNSAKLGQFHEGVSNLQCLDTSTDIQRQG